jgi:predicted phosphodiesterase
MSNNIVSQRFNTVINILRAVIKNQTSITLEESAAGISEGYVRKSKKIFNNALSSDLLTKKELKMFHDLYEKALLSKKVHISSEKYAEGSDDTDFDKRAIGVAVRENEEDPYSTIIGYRYKIFLRDREAIEGSLSREQMEKIYHLYPYVTSNNVSQEFPFLTFIEFKKVLRAFNITKDRLFPPHILEEKNEHEVAILTLKAKERAASKKIVDVKEKFLEDELKIAREKNTKFEKGEKWVEEVISKLTKKYFAGEEDGIDFKTKLSDLQQPHIKRVVDEAYVARVSKPLRKDGKDTFAFFGDIHFGKVYNPKHTRFGRGTNKRILKERCMKMAEVTMKEAIILGSDNVNLICLGDLFECLIPENMHVSQKYSFDLIEDEQIDFGIDVFIEMLAYMLAQQPNIKIKLFGIGGNHDRITKGRDDDRHRIGAKMFFSFLSKLSKAIFKDKVEIEYFKEGVMSFEADGISVITSHGEEAIAKKDAEKIMNMHKVGDSQNFTVIASGHLHNFSQKPYDEGINYARFQVSSICSADDYSVNKIGVGAQPSFVLGSRADGYGFDFAKKTLA